MKIKSSFIARLHFILFFVCIVLKKISKKENTSWDHLFSVEIFRNNKLFLLKMVRVWLWILKFFSSLWILLCICLCSSIHSAGSALYFSIKQVSFFFFSLLFARFNSDTCPRFYLRPVELIIRGFSLAIVIVIIITSTYEHACTHKYKE